jgi:RNA polymerase sigma-70 factor (ECF subfamily)
MRLLSEQDRATWDRALIAEGSALLTRALGRRPPTRYAVEAAIAAVHAEAPAWADTDWPQIVALYDVLRALWPGSSVVALNRAAAIGFRDGPQAGLDALEPLLADPSLAGYGYLAAARADFLRRLSRCAEAADAYEEALALTANPAERDFLESRLAEVRRLA